MKKIYLIIVVALAACVLQNTNEYNEKSHPIMGDWCFLNGRGIYSEAFFGDTIYFTYTRRFGRMQSFRYVVKNDSLYSDFNKQASDLKRIAKLTFIGADTVVLKTELSVDTLIRIQPDQPTLGNTNLDMDSLKYRIAFMNRYEKLLISKSILTEEEVRKFKEDQVIPDDVKPN